MKVDILEYAISYERMCNMCEKFLQVQYTCTITWAYCAHCNPCKGHIEYDVPAEWVFTTDQSSLKQSVERRWQIIKGDDALRVTNFRITHVRPDVRTDVNQIGA